MRKAEFFALPKRIYFLGRLQVRLSLKIKTWPQISHANIPERKNLEIFAILKESWLQFSRFFLSGMASRRILGQIWIIVRLLFYQFEPKNRINALREN
jgi:hypothetical protein